VSGEALFLNDRNSAAEFSTNVVAEGFLDKLRKIYPGWEIYMVASAKGNLRRNPSEWQRAQERETVPAPKFKIGDWLYYTYGEGKSVYGRVSKVGNYDDYAKTWRYHVSQLNGGQLWWNESGRKKVTSSAAIKRLNKQYFSERS
jgi:hypothetical protein